jgi:hypothetical protein
VKGNPAFAKEYFPQMTQIIADFMFPRFEEHSPSNPFGQNKFFADGLLQSATSV